MQLNKEIAGHVRDDLQQRGHDVSTTSRPIGHPVMLYIDRADGTIYAAGDPKADRHEAVVP